MKRLFGWLILLAIGFAGASAVDSAIRKLWSQPGRLSFVLSPKSSRTGPDSAGIPTEKHWLLSSSVEFIAGEATGGPGSCLSSLQVPFRVFRGSGGAIRTPDLLVMSQPSYLCSTPHGHVVPQHLAVSEVQKQRAFSATGNQQDERALLRFARPTGPSLLPAAEIVNLAANGHDSLTGAVVERTAYSRSLWEFEVVARPRHPLFGLPLFVTAFENGVPIKRHSDFVAQPNDARKPLAAFCRRTLTVSWSAA